MRVENLIEAIKDFVREKTQGTMAMAGWECKIDTLSQFSSQEMNLHMDFRTRDLYELYCFNDALATADMYKYSTMTIKKVIFNDPATIVFWMDGTKTVVKCSEDDEYNPDAGIAFAFMKKYFGNDNSYHKILKKHTKEYFLKKIAAAAREEKQSKNRENKFCETSCNTCKYYDRRGRCLHTAEHCFGYENYEPKE